MISLRFYSNVTFLLSPPLQFFPKVDKKMCSYPQPMGIRKPLRDRLGPNFPNHRSNYRCSRSLQRPVGTEDSKAQPGNVSWRLQHPAGTTDVNTRQGNVLERQPARMLVGAAHDAIVTQEKHRETKSASAVEEETEQQTPNLVTTQGKLTKGATAWDGKKPVLLNIETFLAKLGLSKYLYSFKAEEIDLYALKHMDEDDLKAVGLPMGPRKKILYTIARLKAKK